MRSRMLGTVSAALLLFGSAHADAIFHTGNTISNQVNVTGTLGGTGMTITGVVNAGGVQAPIEFTSPQNMMGGNGAANSVSVTSGFINSVTISSPGFSFSSIQFNPQELSSAGILMVSVLMTNGQTFTCPGSPTCPISTYGGNGQNFLGVFAQNGEKISSVTISSTAGPGTGFSSLDQVRFSNVPGEFTPTPIPEPGSLWLLGAGVIGLAGMARRKLGM